MSIALLVQHPIFDYDTLFELDEVAHNSGFIHHFSLLPIREIHSFYLWIFRIPYSVSQNWSIYGYFPYVTVDAQGVFYHSDLLVRQIQTK